MDKTPTAQKKTALLKKLSGSGVQCNICGWEGRAFANDSWHPASICPVCGSQVRHRMLAAIFDGHSNLPGLDQNSVLFGKNILHFAPERQLRDRIRKIASRHTTADYDRGDCDLKLNMSAMRELHRILKIGGTAILSDPKRPTLNNR